MTCLLSEAELLNRLKVLSSDLEIVIIHDWCWFIFVLIGFNFWSRFSFYISREFHVWLPAYHTLFQLKGFWILSRIELRNVVNTVNVRSGISKKTG